MIAKKKTTLWNFLHKSGLLILSSLLVASVDAEGQTQDLQDAFLEYTGNRFQEKLYVQTDKEQYLAGEIIWLKIFNVDAYYHKPLALSKLAYAELLDMNNQVIMSAKIKLDTGKGAGSFYITSQVATGNFKLRAYTSWMKNFSADLYFEKQLSIINTIKDVGKMPDKPAPAHDIQFFAEGGQLVNGITSTLAFRVTNEIGKGQQFSGYLVNNNEDTVARFQPAAFGIGRFQFSPVPQQTYRSIIQFSGGKTVITGLTPALEQGYVMSVTNQEADQVELKVETNITTSKQVYLLAHTREILQFVKALPIINGKASLTINKNEIGKGITHFTLFDDNQQPVCERLFFVPPTKLEINIDVAAKDYSTREQVRVGLANASKEKGIKADLSLLVYKIDSLQTLPRADISSYLWLSSDMKGRIESPGYYFTLPAIEAAIAFDNLMLTHGWRRFNWANIKKNSALAPTFPPEYQGQIVTAKVSDSRTGKPAAAIEAFLSVPAEDKFTNASSDINGKLSFEMKELYGPATLIVQARQNADSSLQVEMVSPFSKEFSAEPLTPFSLPSLPSSLLQHHMSVQVSNVFHGSRLNIINRPDIDTVSFYGPAKSNYLIEDYTRFKTIEEILREYVQMIFVKKRGGQAYIQVYDEDAKIFLNNDALVLLDGVPVFDINKVMALDPMQLRRLEVMNRKYLFGNSIFDGILHWKSVDRNLAGYQLDKQVKSVDYEGLQLQRIFYSPVYDSGEKVASYVPDFRNLLYWTPDIKINSSDPVTLTFYTSDLPGKYVIIAEGLSDNGNTGTSMRFIEVKKR